MRSIFPKLLKLDDEMLPPPIKFDIEETVSLPSIKGSVIPDDTKEFILGFINQYYSIYDSGNRQPLHDAYHEQAVFSFSISLQGVHHKNKNSAHFPLNMFQESRNLLRVKDRSMQTRLLKRGKEEIVRTLMDFPKTKHESESFLIDVYVINPGLINVVINGVLREINEKRERDKPNIQTRAFCRNFLIIPNLIINDLLVVTNATVEQIQKFGKDNSILQSVSNEPSTSYSAKTSTPIISPSTSFSGDSVNIKDTMIKQFSQTTGMNASFSSNCLQEFDFDYNKAIDAFRQLNLQGSIPSEAFQW